MRNIRKQCFLPILPTLLFKSEAHLFGFGSSSLSIISFNVYIVGYLCLVHFVDVTSYI